MTHWEYLVTEPYGTDHDEQREQDALDLDGESGWELVAVRDGRNGPRFYYKRPLGKRAAPPSSEDKT